ncbi:MAG: YkgJ family cysteine cluster protein [Pseudomonadota bacterium]
MIWPIMTTERDERWDCRGCGRCCRGNIVPLHDDDLQRLRAQHWDKHPDFAHQPFIVRQGLFSRQYRLAQRGDGTCVFLGKDNLCRIHQEFGFYEKPLTCRMYPLQVVPLEKIAILTLRRSCPVAAAGEGARLAEHLGEAHKYVQIRPRLVEPASPPAIVKNQSRPWSDVVMIAETLEKLVKDQKYPLSRRLVHGLWLCNLLEECRLKNLDAGELRDLVAFFAKAAPQKAEEMYLNPANPGTAAGVLFRQSIAAYLRLHPLNDIHESWRERWFLFITAFAFTSGKGSVPALHPAFPDAKFADVEQRVLGPLDNKIQGLFNDYFESNLSSKQYAIVSRPGWPLLDKFRALALALPVAFWMLRYFSGNALPARKTAISIITTIDRGQGYAPLTGTHHRQRIASLKSLRALEKLIIWYDR